MRDHLKRGLLQALYWTGGQRLCARVSGGAGVILMMHRVVAAKSESPAEYLTITDDFLDKVIARLKRENLDFISLDALRARLAAGGSGRRFVALTFDDGYRDNLTVALPVLRKHGVPAAVYVASGAIDRDMDVWYLRLQRAILDNEELSLAALGPPSPVSLRAPAEKASVYARLIDYIHGDMDSRKQLVFSLLPASRITDAELMDEAFLNWRELRELAADPLITIGAHTRTHPVLANLSEEKAFSEMARGRERLISELGVSATHFAYPYGGPLECGPREFALAARAGFATAVTTRYGAVFPQHQEHLHALPRMTLGGPVERLSDVVLDVSGSRTALSRKLLRPVVTA
jgi:peptidoglycan/xylan/chitin deacetylase (PgdA/CDA1 family)